MLSYPGCHVRDVHWLYWNSHGGHWSQCYVKFKSSCHIASQRIRELLGAFFKHKMRHFMVHFMVSKKKNPLFALRWDRKIRPSRSVCHHSASLVMPNRDPRDGFFYPIFTLMMDSYIPELSQIALQDFADDPLINLTWFWIYFSTAVSVLSV